MASSLEYVQYVAAQLSGAGAISYKKLFGEYGLWCGREQPVLYKGDRSRT